MTGYDQLVLRYFAHGEAERALLTAVAARADAALAATGKVDFRAFPDAPGRRLAVAQALILGVRRAPYLPAAMLLAACVYAGLFVLWLVAELR